MGAAVVLLLAVAIAAGAAYQLGYLDIYIEQAKLKINEAQSKQQYYFIHALMYAYYAARAIGIRIPPNFAQLLTAAQIIQIMESLVISFRSSEILRYYIEGGVSLLQINFLSASTDSCVREQI
ncbi:GNS1/SUR4 family domain-containing protein [Ditylenchus destructor]|uniref:GNS1/SUR4 family domain-containing protein n=1 Tax=Ditylenchus destructor TaxID=166010 RepID=A0AAD4MWS4_9BILA|nr:GNS1/SUR4 family domain-containing protein [Ditylenchus destructor]